MPKRQAEQYHIYIDKSIKSRFDLLNIVTSLIAGFDQWKEAKYPKAMVKGTIVESNCLTLYENVTGEAYFKNLDKISNSFLAGTPDVIADDRIIDVKSSWDWWSFDNVTFKSAYGAYFWQVVGYGMIKKKNKGEIAHILADTIDPNPDIADESPLRDFVNYMIRYRSSSGFGNSSCSFYNLCSIGLGFR